MRIAITGASGNIGTALLRRLTAGGEHELVAIARRIPDGGAPYAAASWHSVDLAAGDAAARLAGPFAGVDAVVHLAWAFQPSHDVDYLRRLGVGGTAAVLQAARTAGVRHLVHMSSVGAYSAAPHRRVDESAARDGIATLAYSQHKAEAERLLDAYEREAGASAMLVSRLRPGFVVQPDAASGLLRYGLPGFVPARIITLLPVLPLDRKLSIPLVHSDDLADGIARVVERRLPGAFNFAGEPPITRNDIAEAMGARPVHVPAKVLSLLAAAGWHARLQALDPGWIDLAFAVPLVDTTRARTELDWTPAVDSREALRETVQAMAHRRGAGSPVLRVRSGLDQLRKLVTSGPLGNRRLP
ncbi:NAD-dependent epimerase/dehydratase family protein [Jatrophihabitans sp.]|uniref:NAD-dependent epimerase/dehydratase family protein n=1 Tax=Jatrophihabitans sp. TaxID=1932789 RepID=UPI002CA88317|nr:NAD-dependent epimerase/dehydratase family protein [Jatrophihabitans sp.]